MKKYNKIVLTGASGRLGSYLREPLSKITKKLVSTDKEDIGKTLHNEVFKKLNIKNFKEVNKILKKNRFDNSFWRLFKRGAISRNIRVKHIRNL